MTLKSLRPRTRAALRASALGAAAAAVALPAVAQDSASGDQDTLSEVVVTAQFREQRLQDTPIAITAVTAELLEQRNQTSVADIAAQAPNVVLKGQSGAWGPSLAASIRGVGQYTPNPAVEPGVGIYVDDVYYPTISGSILDLLDLDRVEVLRGPQGTLAGKNSIGGAIKLYSKRPTGEGGYLQATYGSRDRVEARGAADFAMVPDKLFMRIAAATKHQDGYVKRLDFACANPGTPVPSFSTGNGCLLGTEGGKQYTGIRTSLRWVASDNVEVNLIADYTDDNSESGPLTLGYANNSNPDFMLNGVPYDSRFVPSDPYVSYATYYMAGMEVGGQPTFRFSAPDRNTVKGWGISNQIDWKINDGLTLTSITAWRGMEAHWTTDNDVSPFSLGLGTDNLDHKSFTQEFRLNGSVGSSIDYTFGAFYLDQDAVNSARADNLFIGAIFDFFTNDPIDAETKGVFAHGVWHVSDKANITAGVRYTEEEKNYGYSRLNPDGTPNAFVGALEGQTGSYQGDNVDYRLGVDYHWTDDLMTYANFSTGFKGGGVNPTPLFIEQVQPFDPETLDSFEIGIKTQLFDRRMTLNVATFFMDYNDIQLTLLNCPQFSPPGQGAACAMPANAGDAEVKGIEIETEIRPTANFAMDASISYLDFEYTSISDQAGGPLLPGGVQKGMVPTYTPEWKASAGMQYSFPLGSMGTLTPRVDVAYTDDMHSNAVNSVRTLLDGYTLVNARLTWRSPEENWEVALEGTNITEEFYFITNADLSGLGIIWQQPAPPRAWGITFKKQF